MAEYIPREAAKLCVKEHYDDAIIIALDKLPAADVQPVVRCRDCKWCHAGYCEKFDDIIPFGGANRPWEEWFCADGKRWTRR